MKRYLALILVVVLAFSLTGCMNVETVPEEKNLEVLNTLKGSTLEKTHEIEGLEFITTYNTGDYDLSRWRITDSKVINMTAEVINVPEGATVLIEHVHIDMSLKSTDPQLDGLSQDNMDDSYHGISQDGFFISDKYQYQNKFAVEGFSKDLIDGWTFVCGSYGSGSITEERLTEKNLVKYGNVYANKMQVVYDVLVKYADEDFYHVVSVLDEFLIPVEYEDK
ncbi:MAG: hypothetical protein V8S04_01530 [Clostridia bacterium]|jgi:hypothetical protein